MKRIMLVGLAMSVLAVTTGGQEYMALLERFGALGIPVLNVVVDGGVPVAAIRCDPGGAFDGSRVERDIGIVFRELAGEFPDSKVLRMETFVGMDLVTALEARTEDAAAFAVGRLGAGELLGRLRLASDFDVESRLVAGAPAPGLDEATDAGGADFRASDDLPESERPLARGEFARTGEATPAASRSEAAESVPLDSVRPRGLGLHYPPIIVGGVLAFLIAVLLIHLRRKRRVNRP